MNDRLTEDEAEELAAKIDSEGFEYYFTDYGPDEHLQRLIGKEIEDYRNARNALLNACHLIGLDLD